MSSPVAIPCHRVIHFRLASCAVLLPLLTCLLQRALVISAGVIANVLFAYLVLLAQVGGRAAEGLTLNLSRKERVALQGETAAAYASFCTSPYGRAWAV